jgi:S1-C subfamily serine protease
MMLASTQLQRKPVAWRRMLDGVGWLGGPARPAIIAAILTAISGCGAGPVAPEPIDAVLRVEVAACGGNHQQRATAVAVSDDTAATVAHTFGSARSFELVDHQGRKRAATVVWLDPDRDIALLALEVAPASWLPLGEQADGSEVEIITAGGQDGFATKAASIVRHVDATLDGEGNRAALELAADIEPGDSGAPLVDGEGELVGIVFAAARGRQRGWAIAASEIEAALAQSAQRPSEDIPLTCS